jgi:hypothetical protein
MLQEQLAVRGFGELQPAAQKGGLRLCTLFHARHAFIDFLAEAVQNARCRDRTAI